MIKFENTKVYGWEAAVRGMRMPMQSWAKSDSHFDCSEVYEYCDDCPNYSGDGPVIHCRLDDTNERFVVIGPNDYDLMMRLRNAGTDHRKFMRMITVTVDITAPMYWWKEFDTYKVGTVRNSTSTMHKIHAKEFTLEDFSCEHLIGSKKEWVDKEEMYRDEDFEEYWTSYDVLNQTICVLNFYREKYLETKDKRYWWQLIQLLPSSYNQKSTVLLNYEVLANMYRSRRGHKLDEWSVGFVNWVKDLPYSELITGEVPVDLTKED